MTTTITRIQPRTRPAPFPARHAMAALRRAATLLRRMHRLVTTRRMLADVDDRTLADLGISRAQARYEAGRRPWDWKGLKD